jgi:hypothetical protein
VRRWSSSHADHPVRMSSPDARESTIASLLVALDLVTV